MRVHAKRWVYLGLILALTGACGGGGGGGDSRTPPPPPPTSARVAVTAANALEIAALGNAFLESTVQIGLSALDNVFDLNDARQGMANMSCRFAAGSGTMQLIDNDADAFISSGDSVRLEYSNCLQDSLGDPASGTVVVDIVSLTINADQSITGEVLISLPGGLTFVAGNGLSINATGGFSALFTATNAVENLIVDTGSDGTLRIDITDGATTFVEVGSNLRLSRVLDTSLNYRITGSVDIDSDLVRGEIDCDVTTELIGVQSAFPDAGVLNCVGLNNSAARVVAVSSNRIRTEVDPEGDGTFVSAGVIENGNGLWGDYVEGPLFSTRIDLPVFAPDVFVPTLSSVSLALNVNDATYDEVNNVLYVTNDTDLVVVDAANMTVTDSLPLTDRPNALDVSDDGSMIWLGFKDAPEMVSVDTQSLTAGTRVALGVTVQSGFDRLVGDLRIAPGTNDTVIVSIASDDEMIAFVAGAPLPAIVEDLHVPTGFEFRSATSIIGIDDTISSFPATVISLGATGLTLEKTLRNFSRNFSASLSLENNRAWVSFGRVFDVDTESIVGKVDFSPTGNTSFRDGVLADAEAGRVYFYQASGNLLDFYDTQTLTALGAYTVNTSGTMRAMLASANEEIFLVFDTGLHRVDKTQLVPTLQARSCNTLDLSGQLGAAYFVQIDCAFNDAVYDAARDLIYASVPGAAGPDGNSVAVIDPATGAIRSYIFVGSEPTRLTISGSGNRLFAALSEATLVAEVDLTTQALVGTIPLAPELPLGSPQSPVDVAASPGNDTDFLVATDQEVAAYLAGVQAANVADGTRSVEHVFYSNDASQAYAVTDSGNLWSFDADAMGLTNRVETRNVLSGFGVKIEDDVLYDRLGALIDPTFATVIGTCAGAAATGVEPDPDNDDIYYFRSGFESEVVVCDRTTLTLNNPFVVPRFGESFLFRELTKAGPNRLVITGSTKMLLLDPGEF